MHKNEPLIFILAVVRKHIAFPEQADCMSWELCLAKWVSSKRPTPYGIGCQSRCCICWSLTHAGALWTIPGRHKAEWEHSPFSQLGWLCLQDHHYITRPLTQRHQANIEDKLITSQGNIQPEVTEVLLQIRREAEQSGETWQNDTGTSPGSVFRQGVAQLLPWRLREQDRW